MDDEAAQVTPDGDGLAKPVSFEAKYGGRQRRGLVLGGGGVYFVASRHIGRLCYRLSSRLGRAEAIRRSGRFDLACTSIGRGLGAS